MKKKRILVSSGNLELRAAIARILRPAGYAVELAANEERARELIGSGKIDAAIVAPSSLGAGGQKLTSELQDLIDRVIVVGNGPDESRELSGPLPSAAVLPQPLDQTLLLSRLAELFAKAEHAGDDPEPAELLGFEGRTVDLTGRTFHNNDGREVSLTHAEFQLLVTFLRRPGRVLSRDQLRNAVAGRSSEPYDRSIDMLVARLRRKTEADPKTPRFILTVPGEGYKFAARPQRVEPATTSTTDDREQREPLNAFLERRQMTVLACRISGIAAFAAKSDPEDVHEVTKRTWKVVTDVVEPFGGIVKTALGDRLYAYFGYLEAQEDDPERAVRAALELVRVVRSADVGSSISLHLRIGIATGVVLVGGVDASQSHSVVGEPLNIALHLQSRAPVDGVVIAASTHELLGRFFDCEELEPAVPDEGIESVPAWRVMGESEAAAGRFDALRRTGMLELVDRDEQMELLLRRWRQAQRGAGQVVTLTGEPGIGKSRLVAELEERAVADQHARLNYFGMPHQTDASMWAVIGELQRACGFERIDPAPEKLRKLKSLLHTAHADSAGSVAFIADLLSLATEVGQNVAQLSPQERKKNTIEALLARIKSLSECQPVLIIVEDIHWIDPASLEFLALLVERMSNFAVFMLVTARPGFSPPWPEHSYVTVIDLPRLGSSDAKLLLERVAGGNVLPKDVADQILAPTEGVPLFVEELTRSVLETGVLHESDEQQVGNSSRLATIPRTLQGSLLARLDRLGASKDIAQIGAVIGREFSYDLLHAVAAVPEPALRSALERLGASGLVYRRGSPPLATYVFKHALVCDAAYGMLLRSRRNELHGAIAKALEEGFPEVGDAQPELLAHHYREADNVAKAVNYLSVAGERALSRSALAEAHTQITQALQLIARLPENDSRGRQELKLQIARARTLLETYGYADKRVGEAYTKVRDLSEHVQDARGRLAGLYGLWAHHYIRGEPAVMLTKGKEFLDFAESQEENAEGQKEIGPVVVGRRLVGTSRLINGDIAGALDSLEQALADYDPNEHGAASKVGQDLRTRFGQDLGVTIYSYRSWALWLAGRTDQAAADARKALEQGRSLKRDDQSLFYALWHAGMAYMLLRDVAEVARLGGELTKYADERELPYWQALGNFLRGWHATHTDRPADAIDLLKRGLELWDQRGCGVFRPICLAFLAEAYGAADQPALAHAAFEEALRIATDSGERWAEPEIHRLFGDCLGRGKPRPSPAAIARLEQAISLARQQGSRSFELRATTNLVRVLASPGKQSEWHYRLSKIYRAFTEGFETPDLVDAKTVLEARALP